MSNKSGKEQNPVDCVAKFSVNADDFHGSIISMRKIFTLGKMTVGYFTYIQVVKGSVWLLGISSLCMVRLRLRADNVEDQGKLCVDLNTLSEMCKGQSVLYLYLGTDRINVRSKRNAFKIELQAVDDKTFDLKNEILRYLGKDTEFLPIKQELVERIASAVPMTALNNVFQNIPLYTYVWCSSTSCFVNCHDNWHMSHFSTDFASGVDFELCLPTLLLRAILDVFKNQEMQLSVTSEQVFFRSEAAHIVLPSISVPAGLRQQIFSIVEKTPDVLFKFALTNEFFVSLASVEALARGKNVPIVLNVEKNSVVLSLSADHGRASCRIETPVVKQKDNVFPINFNAAMLRDLARPVLNQDVFCEVDDSNFSISYATDSFVLKMIGALVS